MNCASHVDFKQAQPCWCANFMLVLVYDMIQSPYQLQLECCLKLWSTWL